MRKLPFLLAAIFSLLALAEFVFLSPGSDRVWALITCGTGIGLLWLMAILIGQRWLAEDELRRLNCGLEQRVNEQVAEVRRRQKELEYFLENATEGLNWLDCDGRIIWANRAELELFGYTHEEYIGHCITEFHANPDGGREILRRLGRGEGLYNCEARLRCKDGTIKHVLINANTLTEDGKFIRTRCFTRDITGPTGLNEELSACLNIIKSHGGFIKCHSEIGQGSYFKVYLPTDPTAIESKRSKMEQSKPSIPQSESLV